MIRQIAAAYLALDGVLKALFFRPGWQAEIDVSLTGLRHSFLAIIPATLLVILILLGVGHSGYTFNTTALWVNFALSWLVFPGAAAMTTVILGVRQNFIPWVVIHNWTTVWLYGFITLLWMLLTAGLIGQQLFEILNFIYFYLRVLVHWRVAYVSLGLPTITSAFAAAVPLVILAIVRVLIYKAFELPAG